MLVLCVPCRSASAQMCHTFRLSTSFWPCSTNPMPLASVRLTGELADMVFDKHHYAPYDHARLGFPWSAGVCTAMQQNAAA
jgi:hypothetical protein